MSDLASVTLRTLRCIAESDRGGSSHSEPYIWPFMAAASNRSFTTTPTAAILSFSRQVIKEEMKAGDSALIDGPANVLSANFEDGEEDRTLILIVSLLEADDLPESAVQAGYQAYLDELKLLVGRNLLTLKEAADTGDADLLKATIDAIRKQVDSKVRTAIEDHLSWWDKAKIVAGTLNLDDFMANGFAHFSNLHGESFTLDFTGTAGDKKAVLIPGRFPLQFRYEDVPIHYQIDGEVTVTPIVVNPCQDQLDAIKAAEDALTGWQHMRQSLQQQLGHATPQQKPGIIASIRQIDEQRIPEAEKRIKLAKQALRFCQIFGGTHPLDPPVVIEPAVA